ncbi:unnamed protein product [Taenia asiatica]|uniref:Histone H4 n=1 Tax=Taenia asiatica TaxID=60517 RepID=A0A0R3WE41_TAEAS|nr:unnamed protein product [Taenia asiatica]
MSNHVPKYRISGRGKSGQCLGKGGTKSHREVLHGNIQGITKSSLRRLARRSGVDIYKGTDGALKVFLQNVIRDVVISAEYAKRKIVTVMSVVG